MSFLLFFPLKSVLTVFVKRTAYRDLEVTALLTYSYENVRKKKDKKGQEVNIVVNQVVKKKGSVKESEKGGKYGEYYKQTALLEKKKKTAKRPGKNAMRSCITQNRL